MLKDGKAGIDGRVNSLLPARVSSCAGDFRAYSAQVGVEFVGNAEQDQRAAEERGGVKFEGTVRQAYIPNSMRRKIGSRYFSIASRL